MSSATRRFRRADRVLTSREYREIARRGRRSSSRAFIVLWCEDPSASSPRLGLTTSRKIGNAVRRNAVKRRVREWFRKRGRNLLDGGALVVIARRHATELSMSSLEGLLNRQVREVRA